MTTVKEITCPQCRYIQKIELPNSLGRKRISITMSDICNALQLNKEGRPCWTDTALRLSKNTGQPATKGFVQSRFLRECEDRGITEYELVKEVRGNKK